MPRRAFGQTDPTVRADALKRHALVRRMERREKWLEKSGVSPALLKEAVETLQAGMRATKLVPAVIDRRGNVVSERVEVADHPTRVRAAAEIADFVRLVSGLTAETTKSSDTQPAQVELIVNLPEWMTGPKPVQITAPSRHAASVEADPVEDAEITESES